MYDDRTSYLNFYGNQIKLTHSGGEVFEEYVIDSPSFPFERWLSCTVCMTTVLLHAGLQNNRTVVLSVFCFILSIFTIIRLETRVKKESLLVIKTVGLQLTTIFASGRQSAQFIAWERIQGVVINEAVTMQQVAFYLAVFLHCRPSDVIEVHTVFKHTLPRLDCLKLIYKDIHKVFNQYKLQQDVL